MTFKKLFMILHISSYFISASMSVKDVLQSLVDDGMVDTERIGTSNYFWAYPSKALHSVSDCLKPLQNKVLQLN